MSHADRPSRASSTARALIGLMAAGSAILVAIPIAWLWLLATIGGSSGTYAAILLALAVTLALWARVLDAIERRYLAASGAAGSPMERFIVAAVVLALIAGIVALVLTAGSGSDIHGPFPD